MKQLIHLNLWLDHPKFGCGKRDYLALVGRKWVTLILVATADHARISAGEFQKLGGRPIPIVRKVASRLRRNAKTYGREDAAAVKEALRLLRQPAAPAARRSRRSAHTVPEPTARLC